MIGGSIMSSGPLSSVFTRSGMPTLEEDMSDLHLSLDCGHSALKSPRPEDESSERLSGAEVSHTMYLSRRSLKDVPDHVLRCTNLQNLYLEGNEISSLPDNLFSSLPSLVWLDLRNNQLSGLPADIGQHRCLRTLLMEGNPVTELPVEMGNMLTLRALSLRNCPVTFPPRDVLQQGLVHILQFLRQQSVARRPLSVRSILSASDMPSVERLPLAEVLQSSVDLCEEANDTEARRFQELRQRMIQMEKADLGAITPVSQRPCHPRTAGGSRSHRTCSMLPTRRAQGMFPELPPLDVHHWKRSEERRRAAEKELNEKQALLEQRRKDAELLQEWRNQARIMKERKVLEHKQLRGMRDQRTEDMGTILYGADPSCSVGDHGEVLYDAPCSAAQSAPHGSFRKETEEARVLRDQELEQRIRTHIQLMQQRRRGPRGPPRDEAQAAALELEEVKKLQLDLERRRQERDLEYRFTAFTGESHPRFYNK
ncbi:leucine-rich repeat-containing protein 27-like [Brachyhypopomus gauderio]|uniref:leucine-rich repeat-containing protein 27-like n=1 Tax=Brachyhypopomus gauderio TaxID=698409 RepID=UPI004041854E